jgi:(2Fe-2S) ferredoxin
VGHQRGCCSEKQSELIRESMKTLAKQRGLDAKVRINTAGCLDQCEHGVVIVVYPEAVWYGFVTAADVTEIVESHLIGGMPVARLRLPPECINTQQCRHRAGVALGGIGLPRK